MVNPRWWVRLNAPLRGYCFRDGQADGFIMSALHELLPLEGVYAALRYKPCQAPYVPMSMFFASRFE